MGKARQSGRYKKITLEKVLYNYYGRKVCHKLSSTKLDALNKILPKLKLKTNEIEEFCETKNNSNKNFILEAGFGMGDNLKYMLSNDKNAIFIGCEPYLNGIANFVSGLNKLEYKRVRVFDKDVRVLLEMFPGNFFSKIILLFPDPWPKRRHQKRRLFSDFNINYFLDALRKNGEIYFGTDSKTYFFEVKKFFLKRSRRFIIKNKNNFHKIPDLLCETKYAKKSLKKGILPKYLVVKKK